MNAPKTCNGMALCGFWRGICTHFSNERTNGGSHGLQQGCHQNERMDTRKTGKASGAHSRLEAVGTLYRAAHNRRQGKIISESADRSGSRLSGCSRFSGSLPSGAGQAGRHEAPEVGLTPPMMRDEALCSRARVLFGNRHDEE